MLLVSSAILPIVYSANNNTNAPTAQEIWVSSTTLVVARPITHNKVWTVSAVLFPIANSATRPTIALHVPLGLFPLTEELVLLVIRQIVTIVPVPTSVPVVPQDIMLVPLELVLLVMSPIVRYAVVMEYVQSVPIIFKLLLLEHA